MNPRPNSTTEEMHIADMHIKSSDSLVHKITQIKMGFNFYPLDYFSFETHLGHTRLSRHKPSRKQESNTSKWQSRKPWNLLPPTNIPIQQQFTEKNLFVRNPEMNWKDSAPQENEKSDSLKPVGRIGTLSPESLSIWSGRDSLTPIFTQGRKETGSRVQQRFPQRNGFCLELELWLVQHKLATQGKTEMLIWAGRHHRSSLLLSTE